jgi:hypothetical protein
MPLISIFVGMAIVFIDALTKKSFMFYDGIDCISLNKNSIDAANELMNFIIELQSQKQLENSSQSQSQIQSDMTLSQQVESDNASVDKNEQSGLSI